jgi:hypothetical protein
MYLRRLTEQLMLLDDEVDVVIAAAIETHLDVTAPDRSIPLLQ